MYRILGYLNVTLFIVVTSPYWLRRLNQWMLHIRGADIQKVLKPLRSLHKPLAACLAVLAAIHGYLALGAPRLHTGSIVWIAVLLTAGLGYAFYKKKTPSLFKWHKGMALTVALLIALHLIAPGALYYLFR